MQLSFQVCAVPATPLGVKQPASSQLAAAEDDHHVPHWAIRHSRRPFPPPFLDWFFEDHGGDRFEPDTGDGLAAGSDVLAAEVEGDGGAGWFVGVNDDGAAG